jgi:hypothetical protein
MREQIANHRIQRASRQPVATNIPPDDNEDVDDDYAPLTPRSAIRYPLGRPYTFQQGNRRIVVHPEPPPRRLHWSVIWSFGIIFAIVVLFGGGRVMAWWNDHQLDATYGMPRTYQVNVVVGNGDSAAHPTHFTFLNLSGRVEIIEIPPDASKARIYSGPTLYTDDASSTPVTADFTDVNGDGHVDMIVHIGDQSITYLNDGTGTFKPQQ